MSILKKILNVFGWIITLALQIAFGQIAGTFGMAVGQGKMPISVVFLWMGITLGVFMVGALSILLRPSLHPKKFLLRLGVAGLAALIPVAVLLVIGLNQGFESEVLNGGLGLILTLLASILGLLGFYLPGWLRRK